MLVDNKPTCWVAEQYRQVYFDPRAGEFARHMIDTVRRLRYLKGCKNFFTAPTAYGTACAAAMLGDKESTDRLRLGVD